MIMSTNEKGGNTPKKIKEPHDRKLETVIGFLTLDVLALTAFGFAGYTGLLFLRVIGACIAVMMIPYARYHFSRVEKKMDGILALVALFFLAFSYYWVSYYSSNLLYGVLFNLIVAVGYLGFFLLGGVIRRLSIVKKEYLWLTILGGLALLVLITTIYSLSRYGVFYALRYRGMVYYFDGVVFNITGEGKFLDGFLFRETSLSFAMAPSFILACSGVGLFSLRPKKDGWRFFALLGLAGLGLLSLALVPYLIGLLLLVPVYLVFLIHRLCLWRMSGEENAAKRAHVAKIIFFIILGLVVISVLLLIVDTIMGDGGFLKKIPLFYKNGSPRRIGTFINRLEQTISLALFNTSGGVRSINFLGLLFGARAVNYGMLTYVDCSIFEFSVFYQNGLVGFAGLLFLIFFGIYHGWKYIEKDEDGLGNKMVVVGLLLGIFLYFSFVNDETPLLHAYQTYELFSFHSSLLVPLTRSSYLLLAAFLLGYVYSPKMKENNAEAALNVEKKETVLSEVGKDE